MAIGTDDTIFKFGTQDEISFSSTIADGAFLGGAANWTNDDDAPLAAATLEFAMSVAASSNTVINLYTRLHDQENGNALSDAEAPSATHRHFFLGAFPVDSAAGTGTQFVTIEVALPAIETSTVHQFYLENRTGQTVATGAVLHVTPKTYGPSA